MKDCFGNEYVVTRELSDVCWDKFCGCYVLGAECLFFDGSEREARRKYEAGDMSGMAIDILGGTGKHDLETETAYWSYAIPFKTRKPWNEHQMGFFRYAYKKKPFTLEQEHFFSEDELRRIKLG